MDRGEIEIGNQLRERIIEEVGGELRSWCQDDFEKDIDAYYKLFYDVLKGEEVKQVFNRLHHKRRENDLVRSTISTLCIQEIDRVLEKMGELYMSELREAPRNAIITEGNKLQIKTKKLELEVVYKFRYLEEEFIIERLPDDKIRICEVIEE